MFVWNTDINLQSNQMVCSIFHFGKQLRPDISRCISLYVLYEVIDLLSESIMLIMHLLSESVSCHARSYSGQKMKLSATCKNLFSYWCEPNLFYTIVQKF